jgi:O-antigen ligase
MDFETHQPGILEPPAEQQGRAMHVALFAILYVFLASSYVSIAVNSISLGLMAIAWIIEMIRRRRVVIRPTGLEGVFLAYLIAQAVVTIFSLDPALSFINSKRVLLIGIVYFLVTHLQTRHELQRATAVLHGAASIVAIIGVIKLFTGNPEEVVRLGVFQFYMTTSGMMMIAGLLVFPFALHRETPRRIRWVVVASLVPILIVLYATVTRGAYLAFLAGALLIVLTRNWRLVFPLGVIVLLGVLFAPPYVAGRLQSIVDPSHPENVTRLMMWTSGIRIFADHPLLGVGDIDLGDLMRAHADPGYPGVWGHLHNIPLQFLVTHGILGFTVVAIMFARIIGLEWKAARRTASDWFGGSLTLGALAVTVGLLVHGLTEWTFGDQEVATLFWIALGLSLAALRQMGPGQTAGGRGG